MKTLLTLAICGTLGAVVACSSSSSTDDSGTGGGDTGGSASGSTTSTGSTAATGGAGTGSSAATGGAGTGSSAATGGAGTGGASNPDAVVLDCGSHTYTPASSSTGAGCSSVEVPGGAGINDFETTDKATWMRHYAQGTPAGTSTAPASFTDGDAAGVNRVAGGGNGTAYSIHYAGSGWVGGAGEDDGIRVSSSFTTCQDVRTYSGFSFWAKGTTGASTDWGTIAANTVVLFLSDGTTSIDTRVALSGGDTWTEYRIPFNCVGDTTQASKFEGYVKSFDIQFHAPSFDISIDEIGFY